MCESTELRKVRVFLGLITLVIIFLFFLTLVQPAKAETGCRPGAEQAALFMEELYGGDCVVFDANGDSLISVPSGYALSFKKGTTVQNVRLCTNTNFCQDYNVNESQLFLPLGGHVFSAQIELPGETTPVETTPSPSAAIDNSIPFDVHSTEAATLNQFGGATIQAVIGRGIKLALGIVGTITLCLFVYAGLLWMTSRGSAEKDKKALEIMLWAAVGIAAVLSSYAIVNFVFEAFR